MCDMCNEKPRPKDFCTAAEISAAVAEAARIKSVNLAGIAIPPAIVDLVPKSMARQYVVMPIALKDGVLQIAISDPKANSDPNACELIEGLKYGQNREIEFVLAPREQIIEAIDKHYG